MVTAGFTLGSTLGAGLGVGLGSGLGLGLGLVSDLSVASPSSFDLSIHVLTTSFFLTSLRFLLMVISAAAAFCCILSLAARRLSFCWLVAGVCSSPLVVESSISGGGETSGIGCA